MIAEENISSVTKKQPGPSWNIRDVT
jgi:hypothetical protein